MRLHTGPATQGNTVTILEYHYGGKRKLPKPWQVSNRNADQVRALVANLILYGVHYSSMSLPCYRSSKAVFTAMMPIILTANQSD